MVDKNFEAIIHLLSTGYAPEGFTTTQKKHLVIRDADFMLIASQLYKLGPDEILRRFVFYYKR